MGRFSAGPIFWPTGHKQTPLGTTAQKNGYWEAWRDRLSRRAIVVNSAPIAGQVPSFSRVGGNSLRPRARI